MRRSAQADRRATALVAAALLLPAPAALTQAQPQPQQQPAQQAQPADAQAEAIARAQALAPIVLESIIHAPLDDVWRYWTTSEGFTTFSPAGFANIELRPGGAYEVHWFTDSPEGQRGSEGCTVLAYIPRAMLAFTWNAPPSFPAARSMFTQCIIEFEALTPTRTRVTLTHHGFDELAAQHPDHADELRSVRSYFTRAWPAVLGWMKSRHQASDFDTTAPDAAALLERFVGPEFVTTAVWSWGEPLVARETYTRSAGGAVESRVVPRDPQGREFLRYHTIYAPGPERDMITVNTWDFQGIHTIAYAQLTNANTIVFPPDVNARPGEPRVRQSVALAPDNQSFIWTVQASSDGQTWQTILDEAKAVRRADPANPANPARPAGN